MTNNKNHSSLWGIFSYLDLYPQKSQLSHKGKFRHSTIPGIISSVTILVIVVICASFLILSVNNNNKRFATNTLNPLDSESEGFKFSFDSQKGPYIAISWTHPQLGDLLASDYFNTSINFQRKSFYGENIDSKSKMRENGHVVKCSEPTFPGYENIINTSSEQPLTLYWPPKGFMEVETAISDMISSYFSLVFNYWNTGACSEVSEKYLKESSIQLHILNNVFDSSSDNDPVKDWYDSSNIYSPSSQAILNYNFHLRKNIYEMKNSILQIFKGFFWDESGTYYSLFHKSSDFQIVPKSSSSTTLVINVFPDSFIEKHEVGDISFLEIIALIVCLYKALYWMAYLPISFIANRKFRESIEAEESKANDDFFIYSIVNKFDYEGDDSQKEKSQSANCSYDFLRINNDVQSQSQNPQEKNRQSVYENLDLELNDEESRKDFYTKTVK